MNRRIEGYDFARAIAIVLMVLVNFQYYLMARGGDASEVIPRWFLDLPSGRSSSLFVTLAGCGVSLMSRGDPKRARRTLLLRALCLVVAGNLLIVVWKIDILHFYAFYLAFAALLTGVRSRWLLALAALITIASGIGFLVFGEIELPYYTPHGMAADVFVSGAHPVIPWFAFVLIGMCIGRLDLSSPAMRQRLLIAGACTALSAELASMVAIRSALNGELPPAFVRVLGTGWSPEPLFVVSTAGTATMAIAIAHAVVARWRSLPIRVLIATGQVALTIYVAHALIGVKIPSWIFGIDRDAPILGVLVWWILFTQLAMLCAYVWRRRFPRGPLEALMRLLAGAPKGEGAAVEAPAISTPSRLPWIAIAACSLLAALAPVAGTSDPSPTCGPSALTVDRRTLIELTLLCPHRELTLEVPARTSLVVETSSAIDPFLVLRQDDKPLAEDDDSGPHLDARIERTLERGRYTLLVRPFSSGVGPLAITARRADR